MTECVHNSQVKDNDSKKMKLLSNQCMFQILKIKSLEKGAMICKLQESLWTYIYNSTEIWKSKGGQFLFVRGNWTYCLILHILNKEENLSK